MAFSGGDYDEVRRWLWNFLTSHAKHVDARIEVAMDDDDRRDGVSYGARLRLGRRTSAMIELDYEDVAANRGSLAWCAALAERTKELARTELLSVVAGQR